MVQGGGGVGGRMARLLLPPVVCFANPQVGISPLFTALIASVTLSDLLLFLFHWLYILVQYSSILLSLVVVLTLDSHGVVNQVDRRYLTFAIATVHHPLNRIGK